MRRKRNNQKSIIVIVVLLFIISLGYAYLTSNLSINGTSEIAPNTWNVHFNTPVVTNGSVAIDTTTYASAKSATKDDDTTVSYNVLLSKPGDFYEFTVEVENEGTLDAMIESVSSKIKIGNGAEQEITSSNLPNYLSYSITYSDGMPITAKHQLKSGAKETYKVHLEYKSDISDSDLPSTAQQITFTFQANYTQEDNTSIARIHPTTFSEDSWDIITAVVKSGNTSAYPIGSTKTVDMGDFGVHTIRVANNSTPSECSQSDFSQTACGFVFEFSDIITEHIMDTSPSAGGWPDMTLYTYLNNDIYNALPSDLKNNIINTRVVSGHKVSDNVDNYVTDDKMYLLSSTEVGLYHEVWIDYAADFTRLLDYYNYHNDPTDRIKQYNETNTKWWLRTPAIGTNFTYINPSNGQLTSNSPGYSDGVSPAFRIG